MGKENHRRLPHRGNDNCFACSANNPSGLKMEFFTDGERVLSWPTVPEHLSGWGRIVHGGVITTMLDEIMGWSALHLLKRMTLTKSITVDFLKPVYVGEELRLEGKPLELQGDRKALMQSFLYDPEGQLCASATGVFALFSVEDMRKRGIVADEILDGIEPLIAGK
jgi:uncharacterized protein (TIGR00369 family)